MILPFTILEESDGTEFDQLFTTPGVLEQRQPRLARNL